jgi:hypothetical protein
MAIRDSSMLAGPISAALRVPPERPFRPASRIGDSQEQPICQPASGEIPIVVFLSATVSLWAIVVMVIGQSLGRLTNIAFPLVGIVAAAVTLLVLAHALRRNLRLVATIGDAVSVVTTGVLAYAARGLVEWPFLAPLTVADDAARHFGMVNWIASRNHLPNGPTTDLLQFAEYPMSAHYLAATIARTFGVIPLRVANALALVLTYATWALLGSAVAFGLRRVGAIRGSERGVPGWQQAVASAAIPLVGYAVYTLTLWAVTASYFYAQVIGLWLAAVVTACVLCNADQLLGASTRKRFRTTISRRDLLRAASWQLPPWWPILALLMMGPSLVYPLHLVLTAGVVSTVVLIERRAIPAAVIAVGSSAFGLAVQLRWLGAATKMSQEEGAILQPTMANLGGTTVAILLAVGLWVTLRTKSHTIGALTLILGAAQVGALALGYQVGAVSKYTSIKVISSLTLGLLVVAGLGAVALAQRLHELVMFGFSAEPGKRKHPVVLDGTDGLDDLDGSQTNGPEFGSSTELPRPEFGGTSRRTHLVPLLSASILALALTQAIRFPPLTGLTRPLVSADGYRVTRWAAAHVDPNQVGIVAPGIEAYSLWWVALDRKKDLAVLRNMQPASILWSEWPAKGSERYLIVVTEGQSESFAARPNVKVLFRSGAAVLLERTK